MKLLIKIITKGSMVGKEVCCNYLKTIKISKHEI